MHDAFPDDSAHRTAIHVMRSRLLPRAEGGGAGLSSCRRLGGGRGGGGRACGARGERAEGPGGLSGWLSGACKPGSERMEHDPHPVAVPPLHECAGEERRTSAGLVPRRGVPVLQGGWGDPGAGVTADQMTYSHGMEASTATAAACGFGGAARDLSPRRRNLTVPLWVTPTQWPPEISASSIPPLDQEHRALGSVGPGLRGGSSRAADREGTHVLAGRQNRGDKGGLRALPPMEAREPPERAAAPCRQLRASWSAGPDTTRPWGKRCRADNPNLGCPPMAVQWSKHP